MRNFLQEFCPVDFFVPFGWTIHKNNIYDVTFDTVYSIEEDIDKFNFLDTFYLDPIFLATAKIVSDDNKHIEATVSIGWNPEHEKEGKYSIYAEIRCAGKIICEDNISSKDVFKIAKELSQLLKKISYVEYDL